MKQLIRFLLLSSSWTALVLFLSRSATDQGSLWLVIIAALLIAFPALLAVLYTDTVALIHKSTQFHKNGLLKRFTTSRILSTIFWTIWSIGFGFVTVFWLSSTTQLEIAALFLAVPVLYLVNRLILKVTKAEMAPYYANAMAIRWSRVCVALLMTGLFLFAVSYSETDSNIELLSVRYGPIADTAIDPERSYLVQLTTKAFSYLQEFRSYLIYIAETETSWYSVALVLGTFALFYNFSFLISGFLIPSTEYRRVFLPLESTVTPAKVPLSATIFTSAIVTIFFFLLMPMVSSLELLARHKVATSEVVVKAERRLVQFAEEIDNVLYRVGTQRQINDARIEAFRGQAESAIKIKNQAEKAFEAMRANVDVYLDSYYSLPAEYLRVIGALTGSIEKHIAAELTKTLMAGKAVAGLDSTINAQMAKQPIISQAYRDRVSSIQNENRVEHLEGELIVLSSSALDPLSSPPDNAVLITLNQRMGAAGVGAIGGLIAAKVVSKVAAKGAIKLAAKAMTKLATSKLVGGATGAAAGAAIGSVVPVAGTFAGAVIGFAAGVIMGVSIDALLLQLEENYSRDEFKAQILDAINEQEREFNTMLSKSNELIDLSSTHSS